MIRLPSRAVVRYRYVVLAVWGAIVLLAVPEAAKVRSVLRVRGASVEATESDLAARRIAGAFPSPVREFVVVVVTGSRAPGDPPFRGVLDSITAALERRPEVQDVIVPVGLTDSTFGTDDGQGAFLVAILTAASGEQASDQVPALRASLDSLRRSSHDWSRLQMRLTGSPALDHDVREASLRDSAAAERRALPLALVVLLLAFGALVAAVLPIIVGIAAVFTALGLITLIGEWHPMSIFVLNITSMVGLGVGIDYSLLIVTRFREELNRGQTPIDAAVRTIATAGQAVLTSGVIVIVGFAALLTTPLIETRSVGLGGLVVVAVAVALATTFLPASLAILGRHLDRPRWLARRLAWFHAPTGWERWARWLGRRPWRAIALGGAAVALLSAPLLRIEMGLPGRNWFPKGTESSRGLELLEEMGAGGIIQPVRVVVQLADGHSAVSSAALPALRALSDSLAAEPRVERVRSVVDLRPGIGLLGYAMLYSDIGTARGRYGRFLDAYLSADLTTTLLDLEVSDTTSLTGAMHVARRARAIAAAAGGPLTDASILVGGFAAASVDLQDRLLAQFPAIVALILGITALMLFVAFRSLLVPLKAVLLNSVAVASTFGVTVWVFQLGNGARLFGLDGPIGAIFVVVPVLVFAVVFGLSMDYEVFLLSRIKESFDKTGHSDHATMEGLSATASVITSAAAIMIVVFGAFAFANVLAAQLMGFALAVAVFLDATLIRMALVPAIMHVAGRWNWWPGVRGHRTGVGAR